VSHRCFEGKTLWVKKAAGVSGFFDDVTAA